MALFGHKESGSSGYDWVSQQSEWADIGDVSLSELLSVQALLAPRAGRPLCVAWVTKIARRRAKPYTRLLVVTEFCTVFFKPRKSRLQVSGEYHSMLDLTHVSVVEKTVQLQFKQSKGPVRFVVATDNGAWKVAHDISDAYWPLIVGLPMELALIYEDNGAIVPCNHVYTKEDVKYGGFIKAFQAGCMKTGVPVTPTAADIANHIEGFSGDTGADGSWVDPAAWDRLLSLNNIPAVVEPGDAYNFRAMTAAMFALRYNTHFTAVTVEGSMEPELLSQLAPVMALNSCIRAVRVIDVGPLERDGIHFGLGLATNRGSSLRHLDLSGTHIRDKGACALADAILKAQLALQYVNLDRCEIKSKGMAALFHAFNGTDAMYAIRVLSINYNILGSSGFSALVTWMNEQNHPDLCEFNIAGTGVGLAKLMRRLTLLPAVKFLDIGNNSLSSKAITALQHYLSAQDLEFLGLANMKIGPRQLESLIGSLLMANRNLTIDLTSNVLGDAFASRLNELLFTASAESLGGISVADNKLSAVGISNLCHALTHCDNLRFIDLSGNIKAKDKGIDGCRIEDVLDIVLDLLARTKVTTFKLAGSERLTLGPTMSHLLQGMSALASGIPLVRLDVSNQHFGDDGMTALAAFVRRSRTLIVLECDHNEPSMEGLATLAANIKSNTSLLELEMHDDLVLIASLENRRRKSNILQFTQEFQKTIKEVQAALQRNRNMANTMTPAVMPANFGSPDATGFAGAAGVDVGAAQLNPLSPVDRMSGNSFRSSMTSLKIEVGTSASRTPTPKQSSSTHSFRSIKNFNLDEIMANAELEALAGGAGGSSGGSGGGGGLNNRDLLALSVGESPPAHAPDMRSPMRTAVLETRDSDEEDNSEDDDDLTILADDILGDALASVRAAREGSSAGGSESAGGEPVGLRGPPRPTAQQPRPGGGGPSNGQGEPNSPSVTNNGGGVYGNGNNGNNNNNNNNNNNRRSSGSDLSSGESLEGGSLTGSGGSAEWMGGPPKPAHNLAAKTAGERDTMREVNDFLKGIYSDDPSLMELLNDGPPPLTPATGATPANSNLMARPNHLNSATNTNQPRRTASINMENIGSPPPAIPGARRKGPPPPLPAYDDESSEDESEDEAGGRGRARDSPTGIARTPAGFRERSASANPGGRRTMSEAPTPPRRGAPPALQPRPGRPQRPERAGSPLARGAPTKPVKATKPSPTPGSPLAIRANSPAVSAGGSGGGEGGVEDDGVKRGSGPPLPVRHRNTPPRGNNSNTPPRSPTAASPTQVSPTTPTTPSSPLVHSSNAHATGGAAGTATTTGSPDSAGGGRRRPLPQRQGSFSGGGGGGGGEGASDSSGTGLGRRERDAEATAAAYGNTGADGAAPSPANTRQSTESESGGGGGGGGGGAVGHARRPSRDGPPAVLPRKASTGNLRRPATSSSASSAGGAGSGAAPLNVNVAAAAANSPELRAESPRSGASSPTGLRKPSPLRGRTASWQERHPWHKPSKSDSEASDGDAGGRRGDGGDDGGGDGGGGGGDARAASSGAGSGGHASSSAGHVQQQHGAQQPAAPPRTPTGGSAASPYRPPKPGASGTSNNTTTNNTNANNVSNASNNTNNPTANANGNVNANANANAGPPTPSKPTPRPSRAMSPPVPRAKPQGRGRSKSPSGARPKSPSAAGGPPPVPSYAAVAAAANNNPNINHGNNAAARGGMRTQRSATVAGGRPQRPVRPDKPQKTARPASNSGLTGVDRGYGGGSSSGGGGRGAPGRGPPPRSGSLSQIRRLKSPPPRSSSQQVLPPRPSIATKPARPVGRGGHPAGGSPGGRGGYRPVGAKPIFPPPGGRAGPTVVTRDGATDSPTAPFRALDGPVNFLAAGNANNGNGGGGRGGGNAFMYAASAPVPQSKLSQMGGGGGGYGSDDDDPFAMSDDDDEYGGGYQPPVPAASASDSEDDDAGVQSDSNIMGGGRQGYGPGGRVRRAPPPKPAVARKPVRSVSTSRGSYRGGRAMSGPGGGVGGGGGGRSRSGTAPSASSSSPPGAARAGRRRLVAQKGFNRS